MSEITLRNYKCDNAKFFLIFCVVLLHFISPHRSGILTQKYLLTQNLYVCLQLLAMPCFTLISGVFSHKQLTERSMGKILTHLMAPYIIFELIYSYVARDYNTKLLIIEPFYILWYLLSLAIWRTVLPYFLQIKCPLLISVIVALLIGFCGKMGDVFALGTTFLYFPFFVLGFKLAQYKERDWSLWYKVGAFIIFCCLIYLVFSISPNNVKQFEPIHPYFFIYHTTVSKALFLRCFWMIISLSFCFSFLVLMPSQRTFFTEWGQRTMYPYLLHVFFLLGLIDSGLYQKETWSYVLLLIALALLTTIVCSMKWVGQLTRLLVEPDLNWLLKQRRE
ncbi:Acyltransferase family protein [Legionella moravica]|uniref:Acyltransferase family protein n=1 Tax=Legionella moravica TaxID=39962 RepID=A0A378K3N8_9GAMM|nr:acyltransferase family protein [Legionella moravica]KTD32376.1 Acyltransferase family protein [Legionella moravica]STX62471.1 Fucose 4-O-acetylase and related acetyltransferases [Legionella moravica]